jgi:hypothetical protein
MKTQTGNCALGRRAEYQPMTDCDCGPPMTVRICRPKTDPLRSSDKAEPCVVRLPGPFLDRKTAVAAGEPTANRWAGATRHYRPDGKARGNNRLAGYSRGRFGARTGSVRARTGLSGRGVNFRFCPPCEGSVFRIYGNSSACCQMLELSTTYDV